LIQYSITRTYLNNTDYQGDDLNEEEDADNADNEDNEDEHG